MKYYRLKFLDFPAGLYLSGYLLARVIPEVHSCESPDEALIFSEKQVDAFFHLVAMSHRFKLEEVDPSDPYLTLY